MKDLDSLRELWIRELEDLWSADREFLDAVPSGVDGRRDLREAYEAFQTKSEGHLVRLRDILARTQRVVELSPTGLGERAEGGR
jgi:ferritin-like metal-binding protein YciE